MAAEEHCTMAPIVRACAVDDGATIGSPSVSALVSLGAMIARALPPPLELDPKKTRKETKKVLQKARRKKKSVLEEERGKKRDVEGAK